MHIRFLTAGIYAILASAKLLVSYDAAANDPTSRLGLLNLQGINRQSWPYHVDNSSLYFKTSTDPNGKPAAHVHKDADFDRAEYHMLKSRNQPVKDTTYYIGYEVRFDDVIHGSASTIVFQWKCFPPRKGEKCRDNVPVSLRLHRDNLLAFEVNRYLGSDTIERNVWSTKITLKKPYHFIIVVNTGQPKGFVQLYFGGKLVSLLDSVSNTHTTKLSGNYFPGGKTGAASPKVGLYGQDTASMNSYIYNVRVGTRLKAIKGVAEIS